MICKNKKMCVMKDILHWVFTMIWKSIKVISVVVMFWVTSPGHHIWLSRCLCTFVVAVIKQHQLYNAQVIVDVNRDSMMEFHFYSVMWWPKKRNTHKLSIIYFHFLSCSLLCRKFVVFTYHLSTLWSLLATQKSATLIK